MATLQDFKKDLALFVEAGLIAIKQGDEESAKKLFNAIGIVDPENTSKEIGYGLIALHKLESRKAQKYFNEVLKKEPDNYRAKAFLGFACVASSMEAEIPDDEKVQNLEKGAVIATEILEKCDVADTRKLAQSLLDWETELEQKGKQPGPAE